MRGASRAAAVRVPTGCFRFVTRGIEQSHCDNYRGAEQNEGTENPHDGARRNLIVEFGHTKEPGYRGIRGVERPIGKAENGGESRSD